MSTDPRAGTPAQPADLVDVDALLAAYHERHPDPADAAERVAFGTSGHRGSSLRSTFNDDHIAATSQAICEYRAAQGIDGPLFIGRDTHALSEPAWVTAIEVFQANDVHVLADGDDGLHPDPGRVARDPDPQPGAGRRAGRRRGRHAVAQPALRRRLQVQPAQRRAGRHRRHRMDRRPGQRAAGGGAARGAPARARPATASAATTSSPSTSPTCRPWWTSTRSAAPASGSAPTRSAGPASPTGARSRSGTGSTSPWSTRAVDPQFGFMTLDWDGKIRMDCSSPYAMASLVERRGEFRIATGNDADSDRHGIVTADGLMNPNHFLAVAIGYLYAHRPGWSPERGDRQDGRQLVDDRPGRRRSRSQAGGDARRVQVVRAGPARRLASASAARRARAPRSCAPTAACGPRTRTGSSSPCSRRRSSPSPGGRPSEHVPRPHRAGSASRPTRGSTWPPHRRRRRSWGSSPPRT